MRIRIDFYDEASGEWHSGNEIEVESLPNEENLLEEIITNQGILERGWWKPEHFLIVSSDIPVSTADPNYRITYKRVYSAERIKAKAQEMIKRRS